VAARGGVVLRNWSGPYFKIKVSRESEAAVEETANARHGILQEAAEVAEEDERGIFARE